MSFFSRLVFASTTRRFSSTALDPLKADKSRKLSPGINRVELLGAVAAEPKFLISRNGDEYSTFRLYTNVNYRKKDGETMEQTDAHDVSVFVLKLTMSNRMFVKDPKSLFVAALTMLSKLWATTNTETFPSQLYKRSSQHWLQCRSADYSNSTTGHDDKNSKNIAAEEDSKSQGWISKILTGAKGDFAGQTQSHSSLLSDTETIYEIQTHDAVGGKRPEYLKAYKNYSEEVVSATNGAELLGSWTVVFGNQDQVVNLWKYKNGYSDIDNHIQSLLHTPSLRTAELEYAALCGRRRTVVAKSFSYWGEPQPRDPSHIYDLRSYVLKPGSMIEWAMPGVTYRREFNQDVGGFFAQIGQLYMVFHLWAYKGMVNRNTTRQHTWSKPGWDQTVAYTVPLIKKMQSRILVPTELSKLK
uniref:NIPSNAP domain-containing protein n=1 Tax=Ditylenchus dipsaci TaxID=166011 RepID=A0A915DTK9_9BILA